jgi:hypothetical protein
MLICSPHTQNEYSAEHDQVLDSLLVGPIPVGVNKFLFVADPPDLTRIPASEILGVTVILLSCSYDGREFVRVGYYVNNEYDSEELARDPPPRPVIERVRRNVLAEKPRVTRFAIKWWVVWPFLPFSSLLFSLLPNKLFQLFVVTRTMILLDPFFYFFLTHAYLGSGYFLTPKKIYIYIPQGL